MPLKLPDVVTNIEAARLPTLRIAWTRDIHNCEKSMRQASIAKLFTTESAQHVINEGVQIYGGSGLIRGIRV
jgi:acyl-CoA dehydrogenase